MARVIGPTRKRLSDLSCLASYRTFLEIVIGPLIIGRSAVPVIGR